MALDAKDAWATLLTALAVLTFAASHESWNVPLVGDSRRWAAGAILVLGMATCSLGRRFVGGAATRTLSLLGVVTLVFAVGALWTGSLTWLSLLTLATVVLWALTSVRHAWPQRPALGAR